VTFRQSIIVAHDLFMTALALVLSFFLRWGEDEFWARADEIAIVCLVVTPLAGLAYWAFRFHQSPWKFVSLPDLGKIALAVSVPAVLLVVIDFLSLGQILIPRTVPAIYWLVQVFLLAGPRVVYRAYRSRRRERKAFEGVYRMPVLIAGAGYEAEQLIRRLQRDTAAPMEPVGLLTNKSRHVGQRIQGVPIVGTFEELESVLQKLHAKGVKPRRLIVTRESLKAGSAVDDLLGAAERLGLTAVRPAEFLTDVEKPHGPVELAPISIDDLLGRSERDLDLSLLRDFIAGRRVLVTGAGGSIGSELCRQIIAMEPARLMLLDHSEAALYTITKEMRRFEPVCPIEQHLGSITERDDLLRSFREFGPELIFHAAALKHVDIVEGHAAAAVNTNALATRTVAEAALAVDALCAVFISTDKAVNPVSILGATKRAGELYWGASDRRAREAGRRTRFLTVRFGNVLGSSGSVIPLFTEQLTQGGPITVTHPDVERYFMTISEAVTLVLMASAAGAKAPETSPTYVLDMGEPVKIVDLARRMIRLAGLEPDREIQIAFTGLRPGERLKEALEYSGEDLRETAIPGVRATRSSLNDPGTVTAHFAAIERAVSTRNRDAIVQALAVLVPEYRPDDSAELQRRQDRAVSNIAAQ